MKRKRKIEGEKKSRGGIKERKEERMDGEGKVERSDV